MDGHTDRHGAVNRDLFVTLSSELCLKSHQTTVHLSQNEIICLEFHSLKHTANVETNRTYEVSKHRASRSDRLWDLNCELPPEQ
jgi:hypothetical protein